MRLHLSTEPPDVPKHKCLALGLFADEKPPRGVCGFIDWRLNGLISREIKLGKISGEFDEKAIFAFPQRIGAEHLLLFGMGKLARFNQERIHKAAYQLIAAVDGMLMNEFSFELPGENRISLDTADIVEAMVTGFFDYLSKNAEKSNKMTSYVVISPERAKDVSKGIKNFKSNVKDLGTIKVPFLK
jgi:Cytosol aminopeptidase family, N-terminal domain